jgi:hypothetical protein
MSADGKVLVWTEEDQCTCFSGCFLRQRNFARMRGAGVSVIELGNGPAAESANGRWVSWGGGTGSIPANLAWLDLETGESTQQARLWLPLAAPGARVVSNDGARVFYSREGDTEVGLIWPDGHTLSVPIEFSAGRRTSRCCAGGHAIAGPVMAPQPARSPNEEFSDGCRAPRRNGVCGGP